MNFAVLSVLLVLYRVCVTPDPCDIASETEECRLSLPLTPEGPGGWVRAWVVWVPDLTHQQ